MIHYTNDAPIFVDTLDAGTVTLHTYMVYEDGSKSKKRPSYSYRCVGDAVREALTHYNNLNSEMLQGVMRYEINH